MGSICGHNIFFGLTKISNEADSNYMDCTVLVPMVVTESSTQSGLRNTSGWYTVRPVMVCMVDHVPCYVQSRTVLIRVFL